MERLFREKWDSPNKRVPPRYVYSYGAGSRRYAYLRRGKATRWVRPFYLHNKKPHR